MDRHPRRPYFRFQLRVESPGRGLRKRRFQQEICQGLCQSLEQSDEPGQIRFRLILIYNKVEKGGLATNHLFYALTLGAFTQKLYSDFASVEMMFYDTFLNGLS